MDLKLALEDRLQVRMDLVTRAGLRAELRERIEREAQPLSDMARHP
jgi:predicted nucleotidyltransferase